MPKRLNPWAGSTGWKAFASHFGADFYGLPRHSDTITLVKEPWVAPATVASSAAAL